MGLAPFRPHLNPKHGSCSATGTNLKQGTNHLPVLNQLARLIQNFTKLTVTFQSLSSGQNRAGLRVVKASACLTGDFRCSRENAHRLAMVSPATVVIPAYGQASGQASHRGHSSLLSGQRPNQPPWPFQPMVRPATRPATVAARDDQSSHRGRMSLKSSPLPAASWSARTCGGARATSGSGTRGCSTTRMRTCHTATAAPRGRRGRRCMLSA